jgi:hypothetical protein
VVALARDGRAGHLQSLDTTGDQAVVVQEFYTAAVTRVLPGVQEPQDKDMQEEPGMSSLLVPPPRVVVVEEPGKLVVLVVMAAGVVGAVLD